ncbi:HNH endonuclease signature motif containing protein [Spiroplasma endosymbiont of Eupeodes luniger]|uniref:HNH endonuclease signature motif containing protein n=1 Tax=Spiroplasma endosymbiont of Eupeodes luniger TaxID=3066300 RepID=UPI0030D55669
MEAYKKGFYIKQDKTNRMHILFNSNYLDSVLKNLFDENIIINKDKNQVVFSNKIHDDLVSDFRKDKGYKQIITTKTVRNKIIVEEKLQEVKYCQFCKKSSTFISYKGDMYFEVHHLIPYNTIIQKYFDKTLDSKINLFVLCPECHRKIHHSNINVQKEMIIILIKFSQAIETVYNRLLA